MPRGQGRGPESAALGRRALVAMAASRSQRCSWQRPIRQASLDPCLQGSRRLRHPWPWPERRIDHAPAGTPRPTRPWARPASVRLRRPPSMARLTAGPGCSWPGPLPPVRLLPPVLGAQRLTEQAFLSATHSAGIAEQVLFLQHQRRRRPVVLRPPRRLGPDEAALRRQPPAQTPELALQLPPHLPAGHGRVELLARRPPRGPGMPAVAIPQAGRIRIPAGAAASRAAGVGVEPDLQALTTGARHHRQGVIGPQAGQGEDPAAGALGSRPAARQQQAQQQGRGQIPDATVASRGGRGGGWARHIRAAALSP